MTERALTEFQRNAGLTADGIAGTATIGELCRLGAMSNSNAPVSIVRHLVMRRSIDLETLLGAVSAYLLIGMCFAFLYRGFAAAQSSPFFGDAGDGTVSQTLFFSFTTLTTTGYGNLVPASEPGQSLAVVEMVLGQLFLITAVGKIVGSWRPRRWSDDAGAPDPEDAPPTPPGLDGSPAPRGDPGDR